jgi:lysozyme
MRHITLQGIELIKYYEGFSPTAYLCPAGIRTIGFGHVIRQGEVFSSAGISREEAVEILRRDVVSAEQSVLRLITVPLMDGQFDALVSFAFNLGGGALQRSTLRRKINRGEHDEVPPELLKWCWVGGRKLVGLLARRRAEARLYLAS